MSIVYVTIGNISPSPWTKTLTAAPAIANAIKTSIATSTSVATYTGVQLNGSIGAAVFSLPQLVTVTNTNSVAAYNTTNAITITGENDQGVVITDTLLLTAANGNQTITSVKAFLKITSIAVPAQLTTAGAFTFGVSDIVFSSPIREIRAGAAGNLIVGYQDATTDTVPLAAGERHLAYMTKIVSAGTTALPITIYA